MFQVFDFIFFLSENESGTVEEVPALEGDVADSDIDLVMKQTEATREQAIDALKKSDGDVVNAIMVRTLSFVCL